ncbi:MAG TPA: hypothetical protein VGH54_05650 [Mycobacterium sp.]|jgi:hypothetical protein|uniref:hypothetical protein n=1 Tax=Mycobacterium sp. TaxID=1785 RepID=UPI002F41789B
MAGLVISTRDAGLLAALYYIKVPVFRVTNIEDAADFARSIRTNLAVGPDMLDEAKTLNYPFFVLYADRYFLNRESLACLHTLGIFELPLELDFLHDRLGVFASPT